MVEITISNEVEVKDSHRDQLQKKGSDNGRCYLVGVRESGHSVKLPVGNGGNKIAS